MNRRALAVAVTVAVLGVALLYVYMRRFEEEASGGELVNVLVVLKTIDEGKPITEEMVAARPVPRAYVEERAVREFQRANVMGMRVVRTMHVHETLLWSDLELDGDGRRNLSSLIQPGMQAFPIRTELDAENLLTRPGDYINVMVAMARPNGRGSDDKISGTLLQHVMVLAVGGDTGGDGSDPKVPRGRDTILYLHVTQAQAECLALAKERGRLTVTVRNHDDMREKDGSSELRCPDLVDPAKRSSGSGPVGPKKIEGPRE